MHQSTVTFIKLYSKYEPQLMALRARERWVMQARLKGLKLREVGTIMSLSRQHVHILQRSAIRKLVWRSWNA